ncbi:MAG: hypothetical protein OQK35_03385 [Alphaproteobacteria bacterium]|nr:hypothetical protein [Alphaproteobacteria bacterium]
MEDITISINMGFTHNEFKRLLPKALRSDDYTISEVGTGMQVQHNLEDGKSVQMNISEVMMRQITPLVGFSNVDVDIIFSGYTKPEMEDKLALIRRGFQKGGG